MSSAEREILIVGLGPAGAAAARLLARLGRRVTVVGSDPELPFDPRIILPSGALESLQFLGVLDQVEAQGTRVEQVSLRGGGEATSRQAGGLAIAQGRLADLLRADIQGIERVDGQVQDLLVEDDRLVGARLKDGRQLLAPLTLCSVAKLLPEAAGPLSFGPTDLASTCLLPLPPTQFEADHHLLHTGPDGWGWALRLDDEHVQYTQFCAADSAKSGGQLGSPAHFVGQAETLRRKVRPNLPDGPVLPGLMPLGRAAYSMHPLSSLGTAHALESARLVAAAANTLFQSSRPESQLQEWLQSAQLRLSVRAHALTALAFVDAGFADAAYWAERSRLDWLKEAVPPELNAATDRALELQRLHRDGLFFTTRLCRIRQREQSKALVLRGAMVRERDVIHVAGGLPIPAEDFPSYLNLCDEFDSPATVDQVLARRRMRLGPERDPEEADRSLARAIGRLYEDGFLVLAG